MKICIYAQGRSGSTSLYKLISNHFDNEYSKYDEPFNSFSNKKLGLNDVHIADILNNSNIIIKTLHYNTIDGLDEKEMPDFLFKHFDKIIFLIREDTISQSESYLYRTNSKAYDWHTPEKYDLSIISENSLNEKNKDYADSNQFLISYCNQIGFPIYTYEDIFIKKNINPINQIFNYLGIELDYSLYNEWVLNPLKKERL
jgi:hypothetical protein